MKARLLPYAIVTGLALMVCPPLALHAREDTGVSPFGVPLGQAFDSAMVSRVIERNQARGGNVVRYRFIPNQRNPLFDEYTLTTTAIGELTHVVTARNRNCGKRCEQDYRELKAGLESKYGSGTEIHQTDTEVEIQAETLLWTLFVGDRRIQLKVTPPGPLELSYVDFSPAVKQALQSSAAKEPEPRDPAIMKGL